MTIIKPHSRGFLGTLHFDTNSQILTSAGFRDVGVRNRRFRIARAPSNNGVRFFFRSVEVIGLIDALKIIKNRGSLGAAGREAEYTLGLFSVISSVVKRKP